MLGPLIAAGSSLLGGWLGMQGAKDANAKNAEIAAQNIALQREFATHGIRWKVADAQKAGVHPLYALGASTTSFSPVSVGAVNEAAPMANALSSMGQGVGRAASALLGPSERASAAARVVAGQEVIGNKLKLDNMQLQNDLLRAKLLQITAPGNPPGVEFPVPENKKAEERPPLMLENERLDTSPGTSPIKAYSDQYGDENIMVQQVLGNLMLGRDYVAHMLNNPGYTRFARELMQKLIPSRFGVGNIPADTHGRY